MRQEGLSVIWTFFLEDRGHLNAGGYKHFAHVEAPDFSFYSGWWQCFVNFWCELAYVSALVCPAGWHV